MKEDYIIRKKGLEVIIRTFLFVVFLLSSSDVHSQSLGVYDYRKHPHIRRIVLHEDRFVKYETSILTEGSFITEGTYSSSGDTLVLKSIPADSTFSYAKLILETAFENDPDYIFLSITIYNLSGYLIPGEEVQLCETGTGKTVSVFANEYGQFKYASYSRFIDKLIVGGVTNDPVMLKLSDYRGKNVTLKVYLRESDPSIYNTRQTTEKLLYDPSLKTLTTLPNSVSDSTIVYKKTKLP